MLPENLINGINLHIFINAHLFNHTVRSVELHTTNTKSKVIFKEKKLGANTSYKTHIKKYSKIIVTECGKQNTNYETNIKQNGILKGIF